MVSSHDLKPTKEDFMKDLRSLGSQILRVFEKCCYIFRYLGGNPKRLQNDQSRVHFRNVVYFDFFLFYLYLFLTCIICKNMCYKRFLYLQKIFKKEKDIVVVALGLSLK